METGITQFNNIEDTSKQRKHMEKALSEITRKEWVTFRWIEVDPVMNDGVTERVFETRGSRSPDEAYQAMMEWDETAEERGITDDRQS